MVDTEENLEKRVSSKKVGNPAFKEGNSLGGRKKGSKNKTTLLREAIEQDATDILVRELPKIVEVVVDQAKQGNLKAAKMILDRAIPIRKAEDNTDNNKGFGGINIIIGSLEDGKSVTIDGEKVE